MTTGIYLRHLILRIRRSFENYLRNVKNIRDMGSHVRKDQEVTSNDKIITLSTCVGGQPIIVFSTGGVDG